MTFDRSTCIDIRSLLKPVRALMNHAVTVQSTFSRKFHKILTVFMVYVQYFLPGNYVAQFRILNILFWKALAND